MIRVLRDDLAFLDGVDAILRPVNERLEAVSAAARRVDQHAGAAFAELCRVAQPLEGGAAVVTGGGALPAPYVVHVVIQDERGGGREQVRRALVSAWQRSRDWELRRLAAPLIGSGAGGVAAEEAARLLVDTFHGGQEAAAQPMELTIVVEREDERELVEAVVRRYGR